jgi:putative transposase
MGRPLRPELAGALYHVTSRGDGRENIVRADGDRPVFMEVLCDVQSRFSWVVHAYCQMINHYHLLVETPDANLSKGMRELSSGRRAVAGRGKTKDLTLSPINDRVRGFR